MSAYTDDDGMIWHDAELPGMLSSDASRCRLWLDNPRRDANGKIVLPNGKILLQPDQAALECVDCHGLVPLTDLLDGVCARDASPPG